MKKALVIGGNGFIGYHLVRSLINKGWRTTVYDRASKDQFVDFDSPPKYVHGELGNRELLRESLEGIDVVFHLAYSTIPKTSIDDPAYDVQSNVVESINLLNESVNAKIGRVVFLSSGGTVYGKPNQLPISENHPTKPISSYGITKLTVENYLFLYKHLYDLSYATIRPANPYGEHQNIFGTQGAIAVFLGQIAREHPVEIWGDGSIIRDYFYVGDLARACILAAESKIPDLTVNIGSGKGLSLNDLLQLIRCTINVEFEVRYKKGRIFDVPKLILDVSRAYELLGWTPSVSLSVGIEQTWNWVRKQCDSQR